MKKPAHIPLEEYSYHLPDEKIAVFPLKERDSSKLLVFRNNQISHRIFSELPYLLDENYRLVFNNTKVIHARMKFRKKTGAAIEIFCLEPHLPADYQLSFSSPSPVVWKCMVGNIKKWKEESLEKEVKVRGQKIKISADKVSGKGNILNIRFSWDTEFLAFSEILDASGETPIPPYLRREAVPEDSQTYQTVYSEFEGSVAAPTAGLHFTKGVLEDLRKNNTDLQKITLHVGAGTFTPVKDENAVLHKMHREHFTIEQKVLESFLENNKRTVAVGTTSCRCLESVYWLGVKVLRDKDFSRHIDQWEPYDLAGNIDKHEALTALLSYMKNKNLTELPASTGIMITPGYTFRMTDVLITNFHQPSSTLLMLIAAFTGNENWKKIYSYALKNDFRFLSYGDSSILFPGNDQNRD